MKWYRAAAEQGYARAQFNLGLMYGKGEGVPENDVRAYAWANLASAQGLENAVKYKNALRRGMTAEQIAEAQKLSSDLFKRIESAKSE